MLQNDETESVNGWNRREMESIERTHFGVHFGQPFVSMEWARLWNTKSRFALLSSRREWSDGVWVLHTFRCFLSSKMILTLPSLCGGTMMGGNRFGLRCAATSRIDRTSSVLDRGVGCLLSGSPLRGVIMSPIVVPCGDRVNGGGMKESRGDGVVFSFGLGGGDGSDGGLTIKTEGVSRSAIARGRCVAVAKNKKYRERSQKNKNQFSS